MPRFSVLSLLLLAILPVLSLSGDQSPAPAAGSPETSASPAKTTPVDLSWLPKTETGALEFLKKHPTADGRGVVVAIFDTGVDPGAAGLQITPDGQPKIVDLVDGTGSGDVLMKSPAKAENGQLTGLSGRTLKLGANWKNPSGEYRLGLKSGYELFPHALVGVVKQARETAFRKEQNQHLANLQRQLSNLQARSSSAASDKKEDDSKQQVKQLQDQISLLEELLKSYSDAGPFYDCVVFHDGEHYRAVIDTNQNGDLGDEELLTNFRAERKYATFADPINLNFAVNIYDQGDLLSIVTDTGAHGTHVAGIVAAYYPNQPEWNGVAPGAQIVSVKIGDTRLEGMETGPGLVRGLRAVLDNNCDLINMSYGEPSSAPDAGRISELYSEIVNEHDVIFLASAGNAGPALTTVGAPGGTTSALISVGAYVSPEMMRSEYSLSEKLAGIPYTWTSRGPTADGDLGVDIMAPGGAIAPVPQWTRQASQLMNGTSMASPNACGNVALLLSAAKEQKIAYTPHSIRKAIQNTASPIPGAEPFATGPGLLQVNAAWDYLTRQADSVAEKLSYEVRIPSLNNARGIYLREKSQSQKPATYRATVRAVLKDQAPIQERLDVSFALNLKSTADWVRCGDLLHLAHGGNRFDVEVDPTGLSAGAHYAEVLASDSKRPGSGPLFRLPITVIIPDSTDEAFDQSKVFRQTTTFQPGEIKRNFIQVPQGATWAELKMKLKNTPDRKFFRIHTLQLVDGANFEKLQSGNYYPLSEQEQTVHAFAVAPGKMLEVTLAQFWSVLGASEVEYEVCFHGLLPDDAHVTIASGEGTRGILIQNLLSPEQLSPKAELKTWRKTLLPQSAKTQILSEDQDRLPNGSATYELKVNYSLEIAAKGKAKLRVLPLEDLLYEAPVGPYIYHLTDKNGQRLTTNDLFPDDFALDAGTYQVELSLHHHDPAVLKKFEKLPLTVDQTLSSPVAIRFWTSPTAAASGKASSVNRLLNTGDNALIYAGEPDAASLPAGIVAGDRLLGDVRYSANEKAASQFSIEYFYALPSASQSTSVDKNSKDSLEKQIRTLKLNRLKTLDPTGEEFKTLFDELVAAEPENREPLQIRLQQFDTDQLRKTHLEEIIQAADALIAKIDQDKIAITLGKRIPENDNEAKQAQQQAEKDKQDLIDALRRKARSVGYRELPEVVAKTPIADQAAQDRDFEEVVKALGTWADLSDAQAVMLKVREASRQGNHAEAIKRLNKHLSNNSPAGHFKRRQELFKELGWPSWENWQQEQILKRFPQ